MSEQQESNSTSLAAFEDTLFYKITENIFPGFVDALIESGLKPCVLEVKGSMPNTILGVEATSSSWLNLGKVVDVISAADGQWASKMLTTPSLKVRKVGQSFILSTTPEENFLSNNNRTKGIVDFGGKGLQSKVKFGQSVANTMRASDVSLVGLPSGNMKLVKPVDAAGYEGVANIARFCGYEIDTSSPVLVSNEGSVTNTKLSTPLAWKEGMVNATGASNHVSAIVSCQKPGMKYLPFIYVGVPNASTGYHEVSTKFGSSDGDYDKMTVIGIPVLDDGTNSVMTLLVNEVTGALGLVELGDNRYDVNFGYPSSAPKPGYQKLVHGEAGYVNSKGETVAWDLMPLTLTAGYNRDLDVNILTVLGLPLDSQHYLCSSFKSELTKYTYKGSEIEVNNMSAVSSLFCAKISKTWYEDYYKTGFGLYSPRASNIQGNILKDWNNLEFSSFGICIDNGLANISPAIVDNTPLALSYKKSRKKACKDDDWDKQKYSEHLTYGELKSRIVASPRVKGFYCVDGVTDENPIFTAPKPEYKDVVWKSIELGYERKDSEGALTYPINETTRDIILVELSNGATLNSSFSQFAEDFSLDESTMLNVSESSLMASDAANSSYGDTVGYVNSNQLFTPEAALSNSGYPVVRFMDEPYKTACIMRTYADLKRLGDPLVRVLESFTGDAIVNKLLKK